MPISVYDIPSGPKNLQLLFDSVDFGNISDYYIQVEDASNNVLATSPMYNVTCSPDQKIRLHFLNSLGGFDAINFLKPSVIHEDINEEFQNSPNYPLSKTDTGIERFNVNSNDTYTALVILLETDMPWLRELADSPKIYYEWTGIEGQGDAYIPVVKIADKFDILKNVNEFQYQYTIQFKLSNSYFILRT